MSSNTPQILKHFLTAYPEHAESTAQPLTEIAVDSETYAEPICRALTESLDNNDSPLVGCSSRLEALGELASTYPDAATVAIPSLVDLAEDDYPDAYRALACVGALAREVSTHRIADVISTGLNSTNPEICQTAAWGLTKLGLTDPDAITPARRQLMELLAADPNPTVEMDDIEFCFDGTDENSGLIKTRQYAAEALAVNATGHVETRTHEPPQNPLDAVPNWKAAGWGIQQCVVDKSLRFDELDLHRESNTVEEHGISTDLIDPLQARVESGTTHTAVASVLALGYIPSDKSESHQVCEFLQQFDESEDEIGRAAHWVLTNPRLPLALHGFTDSGTRGSNSYRYNK